MAKTIPKILTDCILESIPDDSKEFHWDSFFLRWFREFGTPAFFLFQRNLGVTNTQYVELFSLLELHCKKSTAHHNPHRYLFHTTDQFRSLILENINTFLDAPEEDQRAQVTAFAEIYEDLFASSIVVDMFHCSCAVFLPPGLSLDLARLTADAGYIHSAGKSIFIRNFEKTNRNHFENSLDMYLARVPNADLPVRFVVYAHEDFSPYDRRARALIERGIENVKLYIDKLSMGISGLSQIVSDMRQKYEGRLIIPEPGPYTEKHNFNTKKTLWLINDRSISTGDSRNPGRGRYYICYEQSIKCENPFHLFDENKPAWKSHTTLPHSLTAALVNITRSSWKDDGILCDPFGGTGTTWFEAKRISPRVKIQCSDKDAMTRLLVADNVHFFSLATSQLSRIQEQLSDLEHFVSSSEDETMVGPEQVELDIGTMSPVVQEADHFKLATGFLDELKIDQPDEVREFDISDDFVRRLQKHEFFTRLVFYICLRAELRYSGGYARKAISFEKAFSQSVEELNLQIEQFVTLHKHIDADLVCQNTNFIICNGRYSEIVIPCEFIGELGARLNPLSEEILSLDACQLPENAFDAIICDPPYGFNTSIDHLELTRLYSRFLDVALNSLTHL